MESPNVLSMDRLSRWPWREWPQRSWGWHEGWDQDVDFCVHALVVDGLRVPPFDQHGDGTAVFREAGLTQDSWYGWLRAVLEERLVHRWEQVWPLRGLPRREVRTAPEQWPGRENELRAQLARAYRAQAQVPVAGRTSLAADPSIESAWIEAAPYRARVPYFVVFPVTYPGDVSLVIAPAVILVGHTVLEDASLYRWAISDGLSGLASLNANLQSDL